MSRKIIGVCAFSLILLLAVIVVAHTIAPSSKNIVEDVETVFNISINNTDLTRDANITQVNISLPNSFAFKTLSNGTDIVQVRFVNTTSVLSWENITGAGIANRTLMLNQTLRYFTFNATASTPGSFNITISVLNVTGVTLTNITITVNDTTKPVVEYDDSMTANGANLSQTYLKYNVTITDNLAVNTIVVRLFNSTRNLINSSTTLTTSPAEGNFTGLTDGYYYINVTANDTTGNANGTVVTRVYGLDMVNPTVTFSCTSTSVTVSAPITCTCSGGDTGGMGVASTEYTEHPSTGSPGTFTTTCTVTDKAGNKGVSTINYEVTSGGSYASGSSSKKSSSSASSSSGASSSGKAGEELDETSTTGETSQTGAGASGKALLSGSQKILLTILVIVLAVLIIGWIMISRKKSK